MRKYFPFSPKQASRRYAFATLLLNLPALHLILAMIVMVILNGAPLSDMEFMRLPVTLTGISLCAILLITLISTLWSKYILSRHRKYTYIELSSNAIVYSKYAGQPLGVHNAPIYRKLFIIPVQTLTSIERISKHKYLLRGQIRQYAMTDDRLCYRIFRGNVHFDNWWLNENGYKIVKSMVISSDFEHFHSAIDTIEALIPQREAAQSEKA